MRFRKHWRALLGAAVIVAATAAPWTLRNAVTFGQFIPTKSNFYFDAYQASYLDDDGIYDPHTTKDHPYESSAVRSRYARLGEARFMAEYRTKFLESVRRDPNALIRKVGNRLLASTLQYRPFFPEPTGQRTIRTLIYLLPVLGFLLSLFGVHRRIVLVLGTVYLAYLAPYVLVAFHLRYFLPSTPVGMFFVFAGLDSVVTRFTSPHGSSVAAPN